MFEIGEKIVYGSTGVCVVEEIVERSFGANGEALQYYRLMPLYSSEVIYTPVDGTKVFIRPVISCEEANRLIDLIPNMDAEIMHGRSPQELTNTYQQTMRSHDCETLIELIMSIYAKKKAAEEQKKRLGQVDDHFMRRAEAMLHGELAVALNIPIEDVPAYIAYRVAQ